jgi:hypothetical protein
LLGLLFVVDSLIAFGGLPDAFWRYFARGHDSKNRKFAVIVTFSEKV